MAPPLPMDFNTYYLVVLGISVSLIVLTTFWIVYILIQIEAHKVLSVEPDENTLEMTETTGSFTEEEEQEEAKPPTPEVPVQKPEIRRRGRALRWSFQLMQLVTVLSVLLLTYLILVVSKAPAWATILGSLCVFVVFFRYQIGDELRRNRKDRLWLLFTLFLFLAGLMSLSTFCFQQLANGEIYQGPARILQSDASAYNNSPHDPRTRGDILVEWGSHWGCPQSGDKVCSAYVSGVMCSSSDYQQSDDGGRNRNRRRRQRRRVEDSLAKENEELEAENEQLQEEVDELELENEAATYQDEEDVDVGDEEIEYIAEEGIEAEEELADANIDSEIEQIEDEEETEVTDQAVDQDEEEIDELQDEEDIENEMYEEIEEEELDAADEYEEAAEEDEQELEAVDKEISEEQMEDEEYSSWYYDEEGNLYYYGNDDMLEEEAQEEFEGEVIEEHDEDDWYWEEITTDYDDDFFESEYWEYDWDSLWDEELDCDGLFQEDEEEGSVDSSVPPSEDGLPSIMIYGSCKHCEAYVLDYFAEEAFREVELYAIQARLYITGAAVGAILSCISYLRYRVSPAQENQMELLGGSSDGVYA
eukprot:Nitzschia sp. Nitz4//scaffold327_size20599//6066//8022//NITZ4_008635-RA/size20599-augustus-gene-0.4-mRNA-1//-1//CDS//3329547943//2122//frame0